MYKYNYGSVAEWLIATVLKTVGPRGLVGSNPTASAIIYASSFLFMNKEILRSLLRARNQCRISSIGRATDL